MLFHYCLHYAAFVSIVVAALSCELLNGIATAAAAVATSAPPALTATTARMATPDSVKHLFQQHRSMPIIRPRLGAITARLRSARVCDLWFCFQF